MTDQDRTNIETCRILVVGSHKNRLNKLFPLLLSKTTLERNVNNVTVHVQYLPCVATFSSYNDDLKNEIRYLESIEYFPHDSHGNLDKRPSSLLPFFDDFDSYDDECLFPIIAGVAIGSGLEGPDDTARIVSFIQTISSSGSNTGGQKLATPKIQTIEPNPGFKTMNEELIAYKMLDAKKKDEVNILQSMGPEKMVKFVMDFTNDILVEVIDKSTIENNDEKSDDNIGTTGSLEHEELHVIDPSQNRYSCRICRLILFGDADLQYPAHEPSQHRFSYRKINHGTAPMSSSESCQSYFLQDWVQWMGTDIRNGVQEGKFSCPKCDGKIGSWNWSGTQCSCGTWVAPAIQIPKSKVDVVKPINVNHIIYSHAAQS